MANAAKSVPSVKAVKLTTSKAPVAQVELFSIDGKSYTIADKPRVNLGLKVMRVVAEQGQEAGNAFMLEELLGKENFDALTDFDDLTTENFEAIIELASEVVFGGLEADPKAS